MVVLSQHTYRFHPNSKGYTRDKGHLGGVILRYGMRSISDHGKSNKITQATLGGCSSQLPKEGISYTTWTVKICIHRKAIKIFPLLMYSEHTEKLHLIKN